MPAQLSAGYRIVMPAGQTDRTFLYALLIVLLLHVGALVGTIELGEPAPGGERETRGQLDTSQSISVELVEAPDANATTKESQLGVDQPPSPPPVEQAEPARPTPPSPPVQQQLPQPEPPQPKQAEPAPKAEPKPVKAETQPAKPVPKPLTVDDFDVSMADYTRAVEAAQAARAQSRQATSQSDRARKLGAGAVGRQSGYTKSVLELLGRTKPELFINKGVVLIGFELDRSGKIKGLRIVQSSNDPLIDQTVVDWIKRAKYPTPPPEATSEDLVYLVQYTVK